MLMKLNHETSKAVCGVACKMDPSCNGFHYDEASGVCETSSKIHAIRIGTGAADKHAYIKPNSMGSVRSSLSCTLFPVQFTINLS